MKFLISTLAFLLLGSGQSGAQVPDQDAEVPIEIPGAVPIDPEEKAGGA
jgi:hypothetical protein